MKNIAKIPFVFVFTLAFCGCVPFAIHTDVRFDTAKVGVYNPTPFYAKLFAQADTRRPLCVIAPYEAVQGKRYLLSGRSVLAFVAPMYSDAACRHWVGTAMKVLPIANADSCAWTIRTVHFPDGTDRTYGSYAPSDYPASLVAKGRVIDIPDAPNRTTAIIQIPNLTEDSLRIVLMGGNGLVPDAVRIVNVGGPGCFYAREDQLDMNPYAIYNITVQYVRRGRVVGGQYLGNVMMYNNGPNVAQFVVTPRSQGRSF